MLIPTKKYTSSTSKMMIHPTPSDILFGRGLPYQVHPGNIRMKSIIQKYKALYQSSRKNNKKNITRKVISLLRGGTPPSEESVRFLKQKRTGEDMTWRQASEDDVWNKVSHSLRCTKRFKKKNKARGLKKAPRSPKTQHEGDDDASCQNDSTPAETPKKLPRRVSDATTGYRGNSSGTSTDHQHIAKVGKGNKTECSRPPRSTRTQSKTSSTSSNRLIL